jgi:nitroreductase
MSTGERRKMLTTDAPRTVAGDDHPVPDEPRGKLRSMLEYAVLAPSGHNTQVCHLRAFSPASASRSLVNLDQAFGPN